MFRTKRSLGLGHFFCLERGGGGAQGLWRREYVVALGLLRVVVEL